VLLPLWGKPQAAPEFMGNSGINCPLDFMWHLTEPVLSLQPKHKYIWQHGLPPTWGPSKGSISSALKPT
jgi:hypothetical protein